jgi:hemerythrin-like domain-containing protein
MNATRDIKGDHTAITIILDAMKKLALDMQKGKFIDSYRIVQIFDFLHSFNEHTHYEKEEKSLYPALLEYNIPWTADTIEHLASEHKLAHACINEIDALFQEYLSGNVQVIDTLALNMLEYIELEKRHIKIVNTVVLPLCERVFDARKLQTLAVDFKRIQKLNAGQLRYEDYYQLLAMIYSENEVVSERVNQ